MIPTTEHIMKKRHHNRRRLRFISLVLLLIALWAPIYYGVERLLDGDGPRSWTLDGWRWSLAWAVAFTLPALFLWTCDRWLARLLVPLPTSTCPRCGYALSHLTMPSCPECGLPIPAVFVEPAHSGPVA